MAKLGFGNHNQEKIVSTVEEMLRQETGAPAPVSYTVEDTGTITRGTVMGEIMHAALRGERAAIRLFTIHFNLVQPRQGELWVEIDKQGIGSYAGSLLYAIPLSRSAQGAAELSGKGGFSGDADTSSRLNGNADLVKRAGKLLRQRMQVGAFTITIVPFFRLIPQDTGSLLVVNTLPRWTNLGFSTTLDSREVFDLAQLVEGAL